MLDEQVVMEIEQIEQLAQKQTGESLKLTGLGGMSSLW